MNIKRASFLRIAVALLLTMALFLGLRTLPVQAAGSGKITVKNRSGEAIYYLYISPSSSSSWEEDILDTDVLSNNKSVTVNFNSVYREPWDMKIQFSDGTHCVYNNFDQTLLTKNVTLTIERDWSVTLSSSGASKNYPADYIGS